MEKQKNNSNKSTKKDSKHKHRLSPVADNLYMARGSYWGDFKCLDCGELIKGILVPNIVGQ
jgi:hypothetical protein